MNIFKRVIWAIIGIAAAPGSLFACELTLGADALRAENQTYQLALQTRPNPVVVSQPFAINLQICRRGGAPVAGRVDVDAMMPAHRHGMNYKPAFETGADGMITGSGFIFHMPGKWQFTVRVTEGDQVSRLTVDYLLK